MLIKDMLQHCVNGQLEEAYKVMAHLWGLGYAAEDIITIVFRVCKTHSMPEFLKLEFIKVSLMGSVKVMEFPVTKGVSVNKIAGQSFVE